MIRVTNITVDGRIDMTDVKYIPFDTPKLDEKRVKEGDVLMVQCGNTTGKIALVPKELEGFTYGSFSFAIRPKKNILLPEYLELVLRSEIGQMQIWRTINIATVRPNTSKPEVENLLIPIPSLTEQKKIIEEVNKNRAKIEKMSEEIKNLNDSIDKIVPSTLKIDVNNS
ncbi:MAG: restriction endonuclease subunit S [Thermodesulfovibrionales bacterium]|nr:restriction endonuclease subunit S [Thermodesulfovibrionales bacterium]